MVAPDEAFRSLFLDYSNKLCHLHIQYIISSIMFSVLGTDVCYTVCVSHVSTTTHRNETFILPKSPDISPEERAQNVGRILRKEADDVKTKWEQLNADSADWQRRLELALDRLMELQDAKDLLDGQLRQAEMVKETWEPVGDLLIDSLPEHIERVKVRISKAHNWIFSCY